MSNANTQTVQRPQEAESDEWLSALLDGELDDDEAGWAVARLGKDADAMRTWSEYSLIGDAIRGCAEDTSGLERRVKAALAAEPTILAPVAKQNRQPVYWVAAAAAVAAITWTVLSVAPVNQGVQMAANTVAPVPQVAVQPASVQEMASNDVAPYLAAHQDYAFAVAGEPDMHITPVSLDEGAR